MSELPEKTLIDAYLVKQLALLPDDALLECIEQIQKNGGSLLATLQRRKLIDQKTADAIVSRGNEVAAALSALQWDAESSGEIGHELDTLHESDTDGSHTSSGRLDANAPTSSALPSGWQFQPYMRFEKDRPHAEGGLGQVWLASDQELQRHVALKEIRPELADDPGCQQRFIQEAEITGALEHPGIVPIYGLGQYSDGRPFYAMRFIEGQTFKEAIDQLHGSPGIPFRSASWVAAFRRLLNRFLDVCQTMDYAHSKRVIHRDIKPGNIMLGAFGETLIVDWGLAKRFDQDDPKSDTDSDALKYPDRNLTMIGTAVGTPAYMSPEQATGGVQAAVGPASDIFSLGATLYHLLTGKAPSANSNTFPSLPSSTAGQMVDTQQTGLPIPAPLAGICSKAMSNRPGDRYDSAGGLAEDIENWLGDQTVSAYQEGRLERTTRWVRQHPRIVSSTAVGALIVFLASLLGVYANGRYREGIRREQAERENLAASHRLEAIAQVDAALASALVEIRNDRFESAMDFLNAANTILINEPDIESTKGDEIRSTRDRTSRLLRFYEYTEQAEELTFHDSSRRSSILLQRALALVGVFHHLEWWNSLPVDDLDHLQVFRLRERTYRAMFLLTALRLKETIPADLDVVEMMKLVSGASEDSNQASLVLFDLLDAYRRSQGSELGRGFALNRLQMLNKVLQGVTLRQQTIEWNAKNAADLYVMGTALGYMVLGTDESTRKSFEILLGIKDAESASREMLTQASDLQRDHYWAQLVRSYFEAERGEYAAAWRSYSHTISLAPNNWVGYNWYGIHLQQQALSLPIDSPERKRLLQRALMNFEQAVDLNPDSHIAHANLGDTLTWANAEPQTVLVSYIRALLLQEPLDEINDVVVESVDRYRIQNIQRWCEDSLTAGWELGELHGCLALCHWHLGEIDDARQSADKALAIAPDHEIALLVKGQERLAAHAYDEAANILSSLANRSRGYYASYHLALAMEQQEQFEQGTQAFLAALRDAEAPWQRRHAQVGLARVKLKSKSSDALDAAQRAVQLSSTERLDQLLAIAEQQGANQVGALIKEHHAAMEPILQLESTAMPSEAPLFNGGFELGLTRRWSGTLEKLDRPAWEHFGASRAIARVTDQMARSGRQSLHVTQLSDRQPNTYSQLSQTIPVIPGERYQLSVWLHSIHARDGAIEFWTNETRLLSCKSGNSDWQRLAKDFVAEGPEVNVLIRSVDQCEVYIDDISLDHIPRTP